MGEGRRVEGREDGERVEIERGRWNGEDREGEATEKLSDRRRKRRRGEVGEWEKGRWKGIIILTTR